MAARCLQANCPVMNCQDIPSVKDPAVLFLVIFVALIPVPSSVDVKATTDDWCVVDKGSDRSPDLMGEAGRLVARKRGIGRQVMHLAVAVRVVGAGAGTDKELACSQRA